MSKKHNPLGLRQRFENCFHRWEAFRSDHPIKSSIPFLSLSAITVAGLIVVSSCTVCYTVSSDGQTVAYFQETETYDRAITRAEREASNILQTDYTLDVSNLSIHTALTPKKNVEAVSDLTDSLMELIPELEHVYTLTVDGTFIGATETLDDIHNVLATCKENYITENTISTRYESALLFDRQFLPAEFGVTSEEDMLSTLMTPSVHTFTYVIEPGDNIDELMERFSLSAEHLRELNPEVDFELPLEEGQSLNIDQECPLLLVTTVDRKEFDREVAPEREIIEDATMYAGQESIVEEGSTGEEHVLADITSRCGIQVSCNDLNTKTITESVPMVVRIGIKPIPELPDGCLFIWPVSGVITSDFGHRFIFGENNFHRGIDIASAQGTVIGAAESGTVIFTGVRGTYGNLVVISHNNGFVTYYAHCSGFLVSPGDTVQQGQGIALVGMTGRTTGPHCHFEVRYQNEPVDPLLYLPSSSGTGPVRVITPEEEKNKDAETPGTNEDNSISTPEEAAPPEETPWDEMQGSDSNPEPSDSPSDWETGTTEPIPSDPYPEDPTEIPALPPEELQLSSEMIEPR